ncbi:MAG TPA: cobalamin-binding protein [Xanthomonadales bacterium]|nr:cobalamin-binding protein [Xanthomonadales bacterium]
MNLRKLLWLSILWLLPVGVSPVFAQEVELVQADGSLLLLPRPARTIITLSPHLTELAFAAGAGSQLVAAAEYSNYPPEAAELPRIGDAFRLDLERIVSLQPDLVIAWESGNPAMAVERLQALGLNTWVVEIRRPEEIASTLEQMGAASGQTDSAQQAAQHARGLLDEIRKAGANKPGVSYFYQVAEQPLFTLNGQHLVSQSLALCGGENIFAAESVLAPQISMEAVIVRNPAVMFAAVVEGQPDPLAAWKNWPRLQAVRNQRLFTLPADEITRATPRMLDAIATACRLLHAAGDTAEAENP